MFTKKFFIFKKQSIHYSFRNIFFWQFKNNFVASTWIITVPLVKVNGKKDHKKISFSDKKNIMLETLNQNMFFQQRCKT